MKKFSTRIISTAAFLAICGIGTSYYMGKRIEAEFKTEANKINEDFKGVYQLEVIEFERGIIKSNAKTRIKINNLESPIELTFNHDILHGPWASGNAGRIISHIEIPDSFKEIITQTFKEEAPLELTTLIQWNGATKNRLVSPKANYASDVGVTVNWEGLAAEWTENAEKNSINGGGSIPGVSINFPGEDEDSTTNIEFKKLDLDFNFKKYEQSIIWTGTSILKLSELSWEDSIDPGKSGKLEGLITQAKSDVQNNMVNRNESSSIAKLKIADIDIEKILLDFQLKNLSIQAIENYYSALGLNPSDPQQPIQAIQSILPTLLASKPEIVIPRMEFSALDGVFNLSARVAFAGDEPSKPTFNDIDGNISIELSQSMVDNFAKKYAEDNAVNDSKEDMNAAINEAMSSKEIAINKMIEQGIIVDKKDTYATELEIQKGNIFLNKKEINPNQLLGLANASK